MGTLNCLNCLQGGGGGYTKGAVLGKTLLRAEKHINIKLMSHWVKKCKYKLSENL